MKNNIIFISGIDTDAGKSYATGWYAKKLMDEGNLVATIKFIQTANPSISMYTAELWELIFLRMQKD